ARRLKPPSRNFTNAIGATERCSSGLRGRLNAQTPEVGSRDRGIRDRDGLSRDVFVTGDSLCGDDARRGVVPVDLSPVCQVVAALDDVSDIRSARAIRKGEPHARASNADRARQRIRCGGCEAATRGILEAIWDAIQVRIATES